MISKTFNRWFFFSIDTAHNNERLSETISHVIPYKSTGPRKFCEKQLKKDINIASASTV